MTEKPWRDAETLRELYIKRDMTFDEVADELGCSSSTVQIWAKRHGIESGCQGVSKYPELDDRGKLRKWHHEEELLMSEIADRIGCSTSSVSARFKSHGIELDEELVARRRRENARTNYVTFQTDHYGYEVVSCRFKREVDTAKIHRLVAVAVFGLEAVKGKIVHHKTNIPWLNAHDNIELMERSEHRYHHIEKNQEAADE